MLSSRAHIDGALAGWVAWVRLFVEGDFLSLAELIEIDIEHGGAVKEQIVPTLVAWCNKAEAFVVADRRNRS